MQAADNNSDARGRTDDGARSSSTKRYLVYIIGGILVIACIMAITHLVTSLDPLTAGLKDVLGSVANATQAVTDGCGSQADCSSSKDKSSCDKKDKHGCTWSVPTVSGGKGSCINTTGEPPHKANPLGCTLGMFGLLAFLATGIVAGMRIFLKCKSAAVKAEEMTTGKSEKEIVDEIVEAVTQLVEDVCDKHGITDAQTIREVSKTGANKTLDDRMRRVQESQADPTVEAHLFEIRAELSSQLQQGRDALEKTKGKAGDEEPGEENKVYDDIIAHGAAAK